MRWNVSFSPKVSANRKILEDVQYHVRKLDFDREQEKAWEAEKVNVNKED